MEISLSNRQIQTYLSLFRAREDVFAVRWEKKGKSGYMPAYDIDWQAYNEHKKQGGTFKNFEKKSYKPLTEKEILKHLLGEILS